MPVRPSSQAVTSTRMSITLRGCPRLKPVPRFMMVSPITGYAPDGLSDLIQRAQDDPDDDDGLGGVLGRWLSNQGPCLRGGSAWQRQPGCPVSRVAWRWSLGYRVRVCAPASI